MSEAFGDCGRRLPRRDGFFWISYECFWVVGENVGEGVSKGKEA